MNYSYSRYQTLRRLGVEQLPSLCAEGSYDDMGPSSNGSISPIAGDLPLRSMPVSRRIYWTHKPDPSN